MINSPPPHKTMTFLSERFFIPSVNVHYIIVGLYYQNITTTGVWEQFLLCFSQNKVN